jgi:cytochrome c556
MTLIGHHFGLIGAMVQGKVPYDAAAAAANADLVVTLSKLPFSGFIDGTASTEKGGAKASIWTERSKFDADAKTMQDALVKLAEASKTNDLAQLKAAFGPAGKSCKSCHDDYRNH